MPRVSNVFDPQAPRIAVRIVSRRLRRQRRPEDVVQGEKERHDLSAWGQAAVVLDGQ